MVSLNGQIWQNGGFEFEKGGKLGEYLCNWEHCNSQAEPSESPTCRLKGIELESRNDWLNLSWRDGYVIEYPTFWFLALLSEANLKFELVRSTEASILTSERVGKFNDWAKAS